MKNLLLIVILACHQESTIDCTADSDCVIPGADPCNVCGGQRYYADGGCYPAEAKCHDYVCIEVCSQ